MFGKRKKFIITVNMVSGKELTIGFDNDEDRQVAFESFKKNMQNGVAGFYGGGPEGIIINLKHIESVEIEKK